jgi:hypothetical protein
MLVLQGEGQRTQAGLVWLRQVRQQRFGLIPIQPRQSPNVRFVLHEARTLVCFLYVGDQLRAKQVAGLAEVPNDLLACARVSLIGHSIEQRQKPLGGLGCSRHQMRQVRRVAWVGFAGVQEPRAQRGGKTIRVLRELKVPVLGQGVQGSVRLGAPLGVHVPAE